MTKSVKTLTLITILALLFNCSDAQLRLPLVNAVGADIKKVIEDYPNRFINLMGEVKMENTQSTDYQCNFNVNGAEEATVTRYSAKKEICSWEALMLTTENFEKAKQKFKALYNQLNHLSVDIAGTRNFHLKGKYEMPVEEKKFASVLFSLEPDNESVKKLRIEITLQAYEAMEWKVRVLVYDKDREDEERGKTVEE
ncbi:MAG: hypothetical protein SGI83_10420 [Bacteroidota bacterium]|nr:hypothetical protein [Bacteroidota bacterium]